MLTPDPGLGAVALLAFSVSAAERYPSPQDDLPTVFGRKPFCGRTVIRLRCHDASVAPLRGEIRNSELTVAPADDGRSLTTSSKRNSTALTCAFVSPESGVTFTICGAWWSSGPPGGWPADAHAAASVTAATLSRRTANAPC